jgi:hypothetical protein
VRGIIIVNEPDEKLSYAALPIEDLVKVKYYKVNFQISDKHPVEYWRKSPAANSIGANAMRSQTDHAAKAP